MLLLCASTVRYFIKNLRNGEIFTRGAEEETPSASTRKISIMMAALKAVHEGRLDFDEPIVYEERLRAEAKTIEYKPCPFYDDIPAEVLALTNREIC